MTAAMEGQRGADDGGDGGDLVFHLDVDAA